jgi:hypothetical protein
MNAATADPQIDTANGEETRKFLGQSVGFKNELIGQSNSPLGPRARHAVARGPFLACRQVLLGQLETPSRPGRLRAGICRQPSEIGKVESWAYADARGARIRH